ncbi:terminase family protein [Candidatus Dojkabacteria bacterium]|jgi:hypothetical protein|nr:terminase family protein [Candidatus Dojkabacteria bacterium]
MTKEKWKRQKQSLDLRYYVKSNEGLDPWQQEALDIQGNLAIRAGRQVGKSTVISRKAVNFALMNPGVKVLIIAAAQREASFLFEKVRCELESIEFNCFAEKPTMTKIILKNGSEIHSLPTGRTGFLIRGQTIDLLIADEAAYIPELVWLSVVPMIAVSRTTRNFGWVWLLSTPFGNSGFFYNAFSDPSFKHFHISAEDCPRITPQMLEQEKRRLSRNEYLQEWCGDFISSMDKFFPTELIKSCETEDDFINVSNVNKYYLGVDVARYGEDLNAFVVLETKPSGELKIIYCQTLDRRALTQTRDEVIRLQNRFNFNRILIDDTGLGGGLTDMLVEKFKSKVLGINNKNRSETQKKKRILKEDLYSHALILMEQNKLKIIPNMDLFRSLDSIRFEYTEENNIRIFGKNDHVAEAFVRACWGLKEKSLKLFAA